MDREEESKYSKELKGRRKIWNAEGSINEEG